MPTGIAGAKYCIEVVNFKLSFSPLN